MAKPLAGACCVCGKLPDPTESMEWTWSRQRVHHLCMPAWVMANRGRRPLGPWIAAAIEPVLARNGGRLCDPCLALALSVSLEEAKRVVGVMASVPGFRILPVQCHSCGRASSALCLLSAAPDRKCARCSQRLSDGQDVVTHGGDDFHRGCWQVLSADDRIRSSRALTRRSRTLIQQTRAKLDRPHQAND